MFGTQFESKARVKGTLCLRSLLKLGFHGWTNESIQFHHTSFPQLRNIDTCHLDEGIRFHQLEKYQMTLPED